ncbi:integrase, catalytic region, zinc finger, CCHC-type containing protein, partial [Tanacetum coccineum]
MTRMLICCSKTEVLQEQLKVKHVVIDTHTECQAQYAKLEEERYQYMIRYSALCDNDKQHRKKIDEQEILFDKMSRSESSENAISESENQSENDCHEVEKGCDNLENSNVIAPGIFRHLNDLFVFDDVSIRKSQVSKMLFRKKPRDSLNVHSRSNSNKSLPRTVFRWLPKLQPLAEPVAKWIPKVTLLSRLCLFWIIDSGCSKHMTGNRALLTNFVEKFLGTVRFGNNDFAVIAGYGDVVIGSMTIKKVYYVEGLGHNLFSVGQCYILNDYDNVGKLKEKWDIRVFIGYSKESAAFIVYNKRTRNIHESVNVNFDEISEMDSKEFSLEPSLSNLNETGKSSNPSVSQVSEISKKDLEDLF